MGVKQGILPGGGVSLVGMWMSGNYLGIEEEDLKKQI